MHLVPQASFFIRNKRLIVLLSVIFVLIGSSYAVFQLIKRNSSLQKNLALSGLSIIEKVSRLLPIESDTKKEIEVANSLANALTKTDGITRSYLILLQNNFELRPGGGFLGQYAVIKVKDGQIVSSVVEDANLLDQRITAKVTPPWPLTKIMQIKKWKFRDSNFSPDFPTNADKAQYFCRLGGCGGSNFDGVIAVNGDVLNHLLDITGPVSIGNDTYTSANATLLLEERVEKNYLGEDVPAELKQTRKTVMKKIASELIVRITTLNNIPKLVSFAQTELRDRNVMLWFKDPSLQSLVESVYWDGAVSKNWTHDYLMVVDANLGALKTDYYIKRSLDYTVDFTGEHPIATLLYTYNHTATHGDWRTSDYHTYTRVLTPAKSTFLERQLIGGVQTTEAFGKTMFGYKVDVVIGHNQTTMLKYQLPDTITANDYELLIQKQSGIGNIPVTVHMKTKDGKEITQQATLAKDIRLKFAAAEEKK